MWTEEILNNKWLLAGACGAIIIGGAYYGYIRYKKNLELNGSELKKIRLDNLELDNLELIRLNKLKDIKQANRFNNIDTINEYYKSSVKLNYYKLKYEFFKGLDLNKMLLKDKIKFFNKYNSSLEIKKESELQMKDLKITIRNVTTELDKLKLKFNLESDKIFKYSIKTDELNEIIKNHDNFFAFQNTISSNDVLISNEIHEESYFNIFILKRLGKLDLASTKSIIEQKFREWKIKNSMNIVENKQRYQTMMENTIVNPNLFKEYLDNKENDLIHFLNDRAYICEKQNLLEKLHVEFNVLNANVLSNDVETLLKTPNIELDVNQDIVNQTKMWENEVAKEQLHCDNLIQNLDNETKGFILFKFLNKHLNLSKKSKGPSMEVIHSYNIEDNLPVANPGNLIKANYELLFYKSTFRGLKNPENSIKVLSSVIEQNIYDKFLNSLNEIFDNFWFLFKQNLDLVIVSYFIYFIYLIPFIFGVILVLIGYILFTKLKFAYNCWKAKTLKVTFLNWLFDPEILFMEKKLGIGYTIMIGMALGLLFSVSGFTYWVTFLFCGRVFLWSWTKYGIFKLNKKYNWYKKC